MNAVFQWTSVPNAQAYYLYVGTTLGAKDVVNTGEIQETSYQASNLPPARLLYARVYTRINNGWRSSELTFTTDSKAYFINPVNGATNASTSTMFQWTPVPNVEAYILTVGATAGAGDLIDTGEMQQTSYQAANLPPGQTLFARIRSKLAGVWRESEVTFTTTAAADFISPINGASGVGLSTNFQWTSVPNAQSYYLYVGTTVGAKDIVNTGEIQQTSYQVSNLPAARQLYAKLYTRSNNVWRYSEITFTTDSKAYFINPVNGAADTSTHTIFEWTAVPNVEAYILTVGTTAGGNDLVNTAEIQQTSSQPFNLPPGRTLYARIQTKVGGVWRESEISFTTTSTADFINPANTARGVSLTTTFQWTSVPNAQSYYLYVGTTLGAKDIINTGEIHETSYQVTNLPAARQLYGRIYTQSNNNVWRYSEITFTTDSKAYFINPVNGATDASASTVFQWTAVPDVEAYVLTVGTTPGGNDVANTGEILQTSFQSTSLPPARTLYARIQSKVGGVWRESEISFTTAAAADFIYPANGTEGVGLSTTFQWTSVPNALSYYLYVGTTPGARDVVNSGEIQETSYQALNLPPAQQLYGRIYALANGAWRYSDVTFTTDSKAYFISPTNGATNTNRDVVFQWTSVPNVEAYILSVGTTAGAADLISTGETQATSYQATNLPSGQTLFGRIQSKFDGVWSESVITFTTSSAARFIYPVNGEVGIGLNATFLWTTEPNVQAYYLYVGTRSGDWDVVNSGEIQQTSYQGVNLPRARQLYARIYTKVNGVWTYSEISFETANAPTFIYPTNGALNTDVVHPFEWQSMPNAQGYFLRVGTTPGGNDVIDADELEETSYVDGFLPVGRQLFAEVGAKINGVWQQSNIQFVTAASPRFIHPQDGATAIDATRAFEWTGVLNAETYILRVGTTPGARDILDTGEITQTSINVSNLPIDKPLYARVWCKRLDGTPRFGPGDHDWTYSDVAFSLAPDADPSQIIFPANGAVNVDAGKAFEWTDVPLARGYRLQIGTTLGAHDLHDSGEIRITRRFVRDLPIGVPLYGRLQTKIADDWQFVDFNFSVANAVSTEAQKTEAANWATDSIRSMVDVGNTPYSWTQLWDQTRPGDIALCGDYSLILLSLLRDQVNIGSDLHTTSLSFTPTETHVIVEMWNADEQSWMILDPTFDLTVKRTSDGKWATAEDIQNSALTANWNNLSYVFLGTQGDSLARSYYVDYPLLYLNIDRDGSFVQTNSALPFLQAVEVPVPADAKLFYFLKCRSDQTVVTALIDQSPRSFSCLGIDKLSPSIIANEVAPVAPSDPGYGTFTAYKLRRYVF